MRARIAVLGGGASGSLLVRALAARRVPGPVILIDQHERPLTGRRWGSWSLRLDRDPLAARCFRTLRVAVGEQVTTLALQHHEYWVVHGVDLAVAVDSALARCGGLRLQAEVLGVRQVPGGAVVETTSGPVRADWVFDSLGLDLPPSTPTASLAFAGWDVVLDDPVIDPDVVMLMDFRVPARGEAAFAHVLPLGDRSAMVELTAFTTSPHPWTRDEDLAAYVAQLAGGHRWSIVRRESGLLPLDPSPAPRGRGRVLRIGTPAGLVKASTGYGYELSRRDAAALADALARGRTPRPLPRACRHHRMDAAFLEVLRADPATLVAALGRLFSRCPPDDVLAFLSERSSPAQEARLAAALPLRPFLLAAGRAWTPGLRARRSSPATGRRRQRSA